jgi:AraC family transcriptional regulator
MLTGQSVAAARRHEFAACTVVESAYGAHTAMGPHAHDVVSLSLVVAGAYEERFGRRHRRDCSRSSAVLHPAGESHSVRFSQAGAAILRIDFDAAAADLEPLGAAITPWHARGTFDELAAQLARELRIRDDRTPVSVEAIAFDALARLARIRAPAAGDWLDDVVCMLSDESFGSRPTLREIARATQRHPAYVSAAFHRRMGCTMGEFVRRRRVARACSSLRRTRKPLAEIAADCGFHDESHLIRSFAGVLGVSPSAYRKSGPMHARSAAS